MPPDDPFREVEDELATLRASAKSLHEQRPSWFENLFHPGRSARRQADFSVAVVAALKKSRSQFGVRRQRSPNANVKFRN